MKVTSLVYAAMATSVLGQNSTSDDVPSGCSLGSSATATAQSDLDKYSGCETIVGNLTITGALGSAALAGVKKIDGSLRIYNATSLGSFAADSVKEITGALNMQDLTILTTASFGALEEVDTINLITLPAISTFNTNLQSANNIVVSDTSLESVEGFGSLKEVNVLNINNNRYLNSFKSSLESVSGALQFASNADETAVSFDNLIWANNITLRDVQNASFAKLESVNASLGFINNTISTLNLTHLSKVGQSLSVVSNDDLTQLSFLNLTSVGGGLVVANNTNLKTIDGLKNVQTVGGAIDITGNFTTLDLSSLKSVRGGATFNTVSGNFSCSPLKSLQSKGAIQGDSFVCKNGATSTSISMSSRSRSSSASSSASATVTARSNDTASTSSTKTKKSKGAAAQEVFPAGSFFGAVAAVAVALLWWGRRNNSSIIYLLQLFLPLFYWEKNYKR